MIRFYRSVSKFHAITVDLDNTLYNSHPIILAAEEKSFLFLQKYHPALSTIKRQDYYVSKKIIRLIDPEIYHNVNSWRWKALEKILLKYGLSKYDAQLGADSAMDIVIYWRNKINISLKTHRALSALKSRWPIIAITNGNSNPFFYGLKNYFIDVLHAGVNGKAKPYSDMYLLASKYFDLPCKYILHIGDDLNADIQGAMQLGMQSCWINEYNNMYCKLSSMVTDFKLFPHVEVSELIALTDFL